KAPSPGKSGFAQNGSSHKKDKSKIQCFRCKLYGHFRSQCTVKLPKKNVEYANYIEVEEAETLLFTCSGDEEVHLNIWYLD
ncbi:hypothetical protein, partial [Klebsiella pneumoniae]|uniref:hypothetical protein n=1 Tax=Klebsiella pneumoniae TaxID=573 RepID=UPI00272FC777